MATAVGLLLMKKSRNKAISRSKSQPEEEEEVERTVYLRANGMVNNQTASDWYFIKLSSKDCTKAMTQKKRARARARAKMKTKMKTGRLVLCKTIRRGRGGSKNQLHIKPILRNVISENSWNSCFVAVGSTIYCTSAANVVSRDVLAWDTTNPSLQWQPAASMNLERDGSYSQAVTADDGKIYVFGGYECFGNDYFKSPPERFMCEVFDPSKNEWESINPPPPEISCNDIIFSVYDYCLRRIILGSTSSLLVYDLRDASWGVLPQTFVQSLSVYGGSRPVLFDNSFYWIRMVENDIYKCGMFVYDMDLQVLIHGPIVGIHPYFWGCHRDGMQLLHFRGDEFYLIWIDCHHLLRCERMRVSKRIDMEKQESSLECYILSTKTYIIDTEADSINVVVL